MTMLTGRSGVDDAPSLQRARLISMTGKVRDQRTELIVNLPGYILDERACMEELRDLVADWFERTEDGG
jgi:hypothetical protein